MAEVNIQIERFVDDDQPGIVECSLLDASGTQHVFVEKGPIVSADHLWSDSTYPQPGAIRCTVEAELFDQLGRHLVRINTETPWGIESTSGESSFVVLGSQLVDS